MSPARTVLVFAAAGLALPAPPAAAALVAPGAHDGLVATSSSGAVAVAYASGRSVFVVSSGAPQPVATVATPDPYLAGVAVARAGPVVLVEDANGRWLRLLEQRGPAWRSTPIVKSVPAGAALGAAGLTLDKAGAPVVAYALRLRSNKTYLRIVGRASGGAYVTRRVTREGFPPSRAAPSAAPVLLPSGRIRVVEVYEAGGAYAIDWMPQTSDWLGQLLFGTPYGIPAGPVFARAGADGVVYAGWTNLYPGPEADVVLAVHRKPVLSGIVLRGALLAGLALTAPGPVLGADRWILASDLGLPGDAAAWAGLVADQNGAAVELDGKLVDLAAAPDGSLRLLLDGDAGLSLYSLPGPPTVSVALQAAPDAEGDVRLSGRVSGTSAGSVELFEERPGEPRRPVATVQLAADGSFAASDRPARLPTLYRAVYVDPSSGVPLGSLGKAG